MSDRVTWLEWVSLAVLTSLVAGGIYVWLVSDAGLNQKYTVPLQPIDLSAGAEHVAEGERLAWVRGCIYCHGEALQGKTYFINPLRGLRIVAPSLTKTAAQYSDAEFARAVRHGVKADGTAIRSAMPVFAFSQLSDADLGAMLAYIRSVPMTPGPEADYRLYPYGRLRYVLGEMPWDTPLLIDHDAPRLDPGLNGDPVARGHYLAETVCTECHGDKGRARAPTAPDLSIAATYSREAFFRLLRTGQPAGDYELNYLMKKAAQYRYVHLTDAEIDALYSYFAAEYGVH